MAISPNPRATKSLKLITALYNEQNDGRMQEYITCMKRNLAHPLIDEVHVLYDRNKDGDRNPILEFLQDNKIHISFIDSRPTYRCCFEYANNILPDSRIILSNADIFFNETLSLLRDFDLKNTILCLSRWSMLKSEDGEMIKQLMTFEVIARCRICNHNRWLYKKEDIEHCEYNPPCWEAFKCKAKLKDLEILPAKSANQKGYSQDTWIFQTPFAITFRCDFELGLAHSDSFLNYHLLNSSLKVYNPCKDIQCCHLHLSGIKSDDDLQCIRNDAKRRAEEKKKGNLLAGIPWSTLRDRGPKAFSRHTKTFKLITTLYNEQNDGRMREYITCMKRNLTHPLIDEVHVLYDRSKDDDKNPILEFLKDNKIHISFIDSRPTYRCCFEYANSILPDSRIILSNADIFFNETLSLLRDFDLGNTILCLSRWMILKGRDGEMVKQLRMFEVITRCRICGDERWLYRKGDIEHCEYNPPCWEARKCKAKVEDLEVLPGEVADQKGHSQDTWIFQTPLPVTFRCDFKLGIIQSDSFLNHHLLNSSLEAYNPCRDIQCCHLHLSRVKSENDLQCIRNDAKRRAEEKKKGNLLAGIPWSTLSGCLQKRHQDKINLRREKPQTG